MQVLQGDYTNLKCFVTLTTLYSRFDVKVENMQQLPSEIPLASFFVVLQKKTTHKYYIIFHKKNKNNNKQTNKPSALYRAHGVLTRVHRLWKTFSWRTDIRKNQNDILVNALVILLRQYCEYVWYISAPTYLNCKWRCKKLNCAATEITLRFYCALIRTQSHDLYFEHANNTVRQLLVWI